MIRILQLGMTDNLGGIENFLMNYYRHINKEKFQFDFVNIYDNDICFQYEIEAMGGKIYKASNYYKHPIKYIKEIRKIIEENKYDIIHCNMNSAAMIYPLIASKLGNAKTIIAHAHNSSNDKGILKSILHSLNKHLIPILANKYFACSQKAGEWFYSKKIINNNNFYIINNAIDVNKYIFNDTHRAIIRKELEINRNTLVIGHIGRFTSQKNHEFIINVFKELKNFDSKLLLIGIGPKQEKIKKKVKDLNLNDKVLFLNQRNDIEKLLCALDIFILPSLYEGLPLVGVEAQASGLNTLLSNKITAEIKLLETTKFLPINKPGNWAKEIKKVKLNNNRKELNETIINSSFNIKKAVTVLENIYIN